MSSLRDAGSKPPEHATEPDERPRAPMGEMPAVWGEPRWRAMRRILLFICPYVSSSWANPTDAKQVKYTVTGISRSSAGHQAPAHADLRQRWRQGSGTAKRALHESFAHL